MELKIPANLKENEEFVFTVPPCDVEKSDFIDIHMPDFSAKAGDDGYYVHPYNGGSLTYFGEREDCDLFDDDIGGTAVTMPIFGVKKGERAYLVICEGMTYDSKFVIKVKSGVYSCFLRVDTDGGIPYEPIILRVIALRGDYNDIAKAYRKYRFERGDCTPICERKKEEPMLGYLEDSVNIRIRMGWKPVPPEIEEQTDENEPEMKVACTFADIEILIDELKKNGVEKADICLVGFNKSGHDGRWPQLFPIEPKFGGEEGLRKLVKKAKDAGYLINVHTNAIDGYSIAENFTPDIVMKNKDGSLSTHPTSFSAGKPYRLCPPASYDYFVHNLDRLKEFDLYGCHYIDCLTIVPARRCYDPAHPLTKREWTENMNRFLAAAKNRFGAVSSEGGMDFAAGLLDYTFYSSWKLLTPKERTIIDEFIPLWAIVYHGTILYNVSTETVNYSVKDPKTRLKLFEYGGRPSAYCFSRFQSGNIDFLGLQDIAWSAGDKDGIALAAKQISEESADVRRLFGTSEAFIDRHEKISDGVFRLTYSNGTVVTVDYNDCSVAINNK